MKPPGITPEVASKDDKSQDMRADNPLRSLEEWDPFLQERYPEPVAGALAGKEREGYRNYDTPERDTVREFYRLNHRNQTLDFVLAQEERVAGVQQAIDDAHGKRSNT